VFYIINEKRKPLECKDKAKKEKERKTWFIKKN
jgi:hypothetical protein